MSTQQKHFHLKQTLPTELNLTQGEQPPKDKFSLHRKFYDTFAFRDRITNNRFQYKQAREKRLIRMMELEASELEEREELKDSLNVYKFTKNFEINCIRTKYLQQTQSQKGLKLKENLCKTAVYGGDGHKFMSKDALFQINKQEMKRVLQTNDHVNRDIIALNNSKRSLPFDLRSRNVKKNTLKWKVIDGGNKDSDCMLMQGEAERRITEKIINHMKHQIKSNCEYLLNMPTEKKKQALFKSQLKRHLQSHKMSFPNYSHSQLSACEFATLQVDEHENANVVVQSDEGVPKQDEEAATLLRFVKMGFVNQVYLQLKNNPYYCLAKDQSGNNVYHIAAKQGNTQMTSNLLKIIGPRNTLRLLSDKDHMKRTPLDKAKLLNHREILTLFQQFTTQHRHILC